MPRITVQRALGGVAALTALLLVAGCSTPAGGGGDEDGITTVKVGIAPYFEYQPWIVADELGLDEEQGIDLQFTSYDSTDKSVVAAYRGDIDIAANCLACMFPLIGQVPGMQDFMITNQFKGFILIGREGQTDTFEELSADMDPEAAKEQILRSLEGKSFAIRSSSYQALLGAALEQVGMTLDDIEIIDFASDSQAGIAFAGGTGDYYIGSLPQEAKLLESPDEYVNVGGADILGPAGLWFSSMAASEEWIGANAETVDKLLAIWYRAMRYMQEEPDETLPIFTDAVNAATASDLSVDTVASIVNDLERFATLPQAQEEFLDPASDTYYKLSVDFYEAQNSEVIPDDYSQDASIVIAPRVDALVDNAELVEWIDQPL